MFNHVEDASVFNQLKSTRRCWDGKSAFRGRFEGGHLLVEAFLSRALESLEHLQNMKDHEIQAMGKQKQFAESGCTNVEIFKIFKVATHHMMTPSSFCNSASSPQGTRLRPEFGLSLDSR